MASYPPPPPTPPIPPYGGDPRLQRRALREQARWQRDQIKAQRDLYRAQMRGMRRGSVVGPLLVIAIGVVFLLVQLGKVPSMQLWAWYGHLWPFLLIAVGLIRLAEWLFDRYHEPAGAGGGLQPRRVMGGGVVFLLVLLASGGLVFSAARSQGAGLWGHGFLLNPGNLDNLDEFLGDKHESEQTLTHACGSGCTLRIDNPHGDVSVAGTSDDGQVHVVTHKQIFTRSDSEAATKAEHFSPKLDGSGDALALSMPWVDGARADLTVTLPATAMVSVTANRGDVRVNSLHGSVAVTANHGDVEVSEISGPVSTHINNGDSSFSAHRVSGALTLEGRGKDLTLSDLSGPISLNGEFFGTTHLEHIHGPIRFHTSRTDFQLARLEGEVEISPNADLSADQVVGPVMLNTRNRNITMERVSGDLSITNRNGSIDLTAAPPIGNVSLENRNGTVNVTLPNTAGFVVQADTMNGDVDNDFSLSRGGSENHPSLSGTVNSGGPLLRVSTTQGDISIKKGVIAPLPPVPPSPPSLTRDPVATKDGGDEGVRAIRDASREAAEQLRAAQEQVKIANREAAEAQREAQRKLAEAQKELDRASQQAKQAGSKD